MLTPSLVSRTLGWLGVVPFAFACWYSFQQSSLLGFYSPYVFVAYSGTILAFLSGSMWGRVYEQKNRFHRKRLLILSNVFALIACAGILTSNMYLPVAIALLASGFYCIWKVEAVLFDEEFTSRWYLTLRKHLTIAVIAFHAIELLIVLFL